LELSDVYSVYKLEIDHRLVIITFNYFFFER